MPNKFELTREWENRLSTARRIRDEQWSIPARRYIDFYTNAFWYKTTALPQEQVPVNLVYPFVKTTVAAVYSKDPTILVTPRRAGDEQTAETVQTLINYVWRELNLKEEIKLAITEALLTGWGWLKVGYTAQFGKVIENEVSSAPPTLRQIVTDALGAITSKITGKPGEDRQTPEGKVIEFNEYIKKEEVFAYYVSGFNMIVPWSIHRQVHWPWIAEDVYIDLEDVKNNRSFSSEAVEALQPYYPAQGAGQLPQMFQNEPRSGQQTDRPMARLTEVWDKRQQKRIILGSGAKIPLMEQDWPYEIEGFPYVNLTFVPIPSTDKQSNVFPMSPIAPAEPQLMELSSIRTHMSQHRKRFLSKYLAEKGLNLTPDDLRKLSEPDEGGVVEVAGISNNPGMIVPLKPNPMDSSVLASQNAVKEDIELIWGMSQLLFGRAPVGIESATEANIISQAAAVRAQELVDVVESASGQVARLLIQLMRQFKDEEKVMRVIGDEGIAWARVTPTQIQGEYDLQVEAGSTRVPQQALVDRKQLLDAFNLLFPVVQSGMVSADLTVLIRQIMKTFPQIKQLDKIFSTTMEDEKKRASQENELLLQGHPQIVSPKDLHNVHLEIHGEVAASPEYQQEAELLRMQGQIHPMDLHIQSHIQSTQGKQQFNNASRNAADTSLTRSGATKVPDMEQGLRNSGAGTGAETNATGLGA